MKIKILYLSILFMQFFYACDKIDAPYREEKKGGTSLGDNAIVITGDTITFTEFSATGRKVLVEEYTGHLCGSCPVAAITLNDTLKPLFGEQISIIVVHSDHFADVCPTALDCPGSAPAGSFTVDYRTPAGNDWTTFFGINANPLGMVNRTGYPASYKKVYRDWRSAIENELTFAQEVEIKIKTIYNSSARELKAAVSTTLLADINTNLKVQIVLVEDSIVDWQQWYSHVPQLVPDYIHRDVLRTTLNGNYGDVLSETGGTTGQKFITGYPLTLSQDWNASHCKIVAFVYDADTYRVLQAVEAEIE